MKNNILISLKKKWKEGTLGHFYILQGEKPETLGLLNDFLEGITSSPTNHPDILFIKKNPEKKNYSFESDFSELFDFIKYGPLKIPKKIIILTDANLLTVEISNKILRTLEDLKDGVFFFLSPPQISLLPTIESRAITLRVPKTQDKFISLYSTSQSSEWLKGHNLPDNLFNNYKGISSFLDELKDNGEGQMKLFNLLLEWESSHLSNYKHKERFLEEINRFHTSLTFNNLFKERFVSLLSTCQVT